MMKLRFDKLNLPRLYSYHLRPNCLLTRYPICFLKDQKNILPFFDQWGVLPNFLAAHGYQIKKATWSHSSRSFKDLEEKSGRIHLVVAAGQVAQEILLLAPQRLSVVETITVVDSQATTVTATSAPLTGTTTLSPSNGDFSTNFDRWLNGRGSALEVFSTDGGRYDIAPSARRVWQLGLGAQLKVQDTRELLLNHCISLAENDLQTSQ